MIRIKIFSNLWAFVGFNDLVIEFISSFLMETVFKRLLVTKNVCYCFQKEYTMKQKIHDNPFPAIFVIVSPDIRIGGTEGIFMLFRK